MPTAKPLLDPMFEEYFYEVGMPISTARVARSVFNAWFLFLADRGKGLGDAVKLDVLAYRHSLGERGMAVITQTNHISKLRHFYRWAVAAQLVASDPTHSVKKQKAAETRPPALQDSHLRRMLATCPGDETGRRDAAILSLLRWSGLRRSEVCGLDLARFTDQPGRASLMLTQTKNGEARIVPVGDDTRKLIGRYLRLVRGMEPGPLFVSRSAADGRLTPNGVSHLVERARIRAAISDRFGVHSFRRAWAIDARRSGLSDAAIMSIAGWNDSEMIRRYTKTLGEELAHDEYFAKMAGNAQPKVRRPNLRRVS